MNRVTHPLYWSIRRELWENRSISIGPVVVAIVVLIGFLYSTRGMAGRRRAVLLLDPAQQEAKIGMPYDVAATALIVASLIIGAFYCVDALHADRRDRSILFWKSLPVSDSTTVMSKALVPLFVLPLVTFATVLATQFLMLLLTTAILLPSGLAGTTWARLHLFSGSLILLYGLAVNVLWHAPLYGWLLLVSGWARRATFLWAVLPFFALGVFERIANGALHVTSLLKYRVVGGVARAFAFKPNGVIDSLSQLTPGRFLSTPGLWIGLAFAAAFFSAAVRLRRRHDPI